MLKRESFPIAKIYVPVKRRATLRPEAVREIAESMLEIGQATPILVRTIVGFLVSGQPNKAPSHYDTEADAVREKTDRLRAQRLAKEAEEKGRAISDVAPMGATKSTEKPS